MKRNYIDRVLPATFLWTVRSSGLTVLTALGLVLARVPSPAGSSPNAEDISGPDFWIAASIVCIPAAFLVSFIAANLLFLFNHPSGSQKSHPCNTTIVWSAITIFGCTVLVFCGAAVGLMGMALSMDAPHAWKGSSSNGFTGFLIALALFYVAYVPARGAVRDLRSLRQSPIASKE